MGNMLGDMVRYILCLWMVARLEHGLVRQLVDPFEDVGRYLLARQFYRR